MRYRQGQQGEEILDYLPDTPPAVEAEDKIVYTIDSRFFAGANRDLLVGSTVSVRLDCDFIVDSENEPVDCDFLRGELPTGDGVPGGTFESWFLVVP